MSFLVMSGVCVAGWHSTYCTVVGERLVMGGCERRKNAKAEGRRRL